jgi:hypothetical protein
MLPLVVLGAAAWYLSRPQRNPDWITVEGKHIPCVMVTGARAIRPHTILPRWARREPLGRPPLRHHPPVLVTIDFKPLECIYGAGT